jgi:hypothetical protein
MTLAMERELWAIALWVEKHHGTEGPAYIAEQIERLAMDRDEAGVAMWGKSESNSRHSAPQPQNHPDD